MTNTATKKKIAILGGGIGALSTALELTNNPSWQSQIDSITVYQMGWRLGGKCATGRGANGQIQEHGIHLFGGGYYNALDAVSRVYEALANTPEGWPYTFDEVFEKQYLSLIWHHGADHGAPPSRMSAINFPPNDLGPRDGERFADLMTAVGALLDYIEHVINLALEKTELADLIDWVSRHAVSASFASLRSGIQNEHEEIVLACLKVFDGLLGVLKGLLPNKPTLQDAYTALDYFLALLRGIVKDRWIDGKSYDQMDMDATYGNYAAWLQHHGASQATVYSPMAQAPIGILYQFPNGSHVASSMGAGAYLHWVLRTFGYLGAPFWLFGHGTGESLVLPMYELLKRRGVKFEFFSKVQALHTSIDGTHITSVDMGVQATLASGVAGYAPLITVNGQSCWPAEPDFSQLAQGAALQAQGIDLESYWSGWTCPAQRTLTAGTDFDTLVFAISLGAVPTICSELVAQKPAWQQLLANIPTIQTQSLQMWLNKTTPELGLLLTPTNPTDTGLACGYAVPYDGIVDFSRLIKWENWPASNTPKALWYFSDVLAQTEAPAPFTDTTYPAKMQAAAAAVAQSFMDTGLTPLFPLGLDASGKFKPSVLAGQPYVRVNFEPTERYVTAPANTTTFRLKAWESGYSNLYLAGDWTYTGLNVGCVEATVMSGKLASLAISGYPALSTIIGYSAGAPPVNP